MARHGNARVPAGRACRLRRAGAGRRLASAVRPPCLIRHRYGLNRFELPQIIGQLILRKGLQKLPSSGPVDLHDPVDQFSLGHVAVLRADARLHARLSGPVPECVVPGMGRLRIHLQSRLFRANGRASRGSGGLALIRIGWGLIATLDTARQRFALRRGAAPPIFRHGIPYSGRLSSRRASEDETHHVGPGTCDRVAGRGGGRAGRTGKAVGE